MSRTVLRGVRLCLIAQASHRSGLSLNADVRQNTDETLRRLLSLAIKTTAGILLAVFFVLAALLYVGNSGIPFVEGDHVVTSGEAYRFEIGMTKPEVFESIKENYAKDNYYLRTLWLRQSSYAKELESFENTDWKDYKARKYSEHKSLVQDLKKITLPFAYSNRWDIEMPADWVNMIYLKFENESLIEIQKSRWLFERP